MQKQEAIEYQTGLRFQLSIFSFKNMIVLLLSIIGGSTLLYSSSTMTIALRHLPGDPVTTHTVVLNGADQWDDDTTMTAPAFHFSSENAQILSISPLFERYYSSHATTTSLGAPLTVAFPTKQGWVQFFSSGALLLPRNSQEYTSSHGYAQPKSTLDDLIQADMTDPYSGIVRLPLLAALLTYGSQVPVGGDGSPFSYVDLRNAANPKSMETDPEDKQVAALSSVRLQNVFVKEGIRDGSDVGYLIPEPFWSYINRVDVSPDGWETDFGAPLTEAISFDMTKSGSVHRMLVQAFSHDGLLLDEDSLDTAGKPEIKRLDTGAAYLQTFGPPEVAIQPMERIWVQGDDFTTILREPGNGGPVAHVGQHFPLSLLGDTTWTGNMLWYHVQWAVAKRRGTGCVPASAITFSSPGKVASVAEFDVLSPDLASYLATMGNNVGVAVYDMTRQQYYTYQSDGQFITGSSIKVPIMLTFLNMIEQQHRQPSDYELYLLTTMIENSDNDSAGILYNSEVGDAGGVASYMQAIGITGLNPYPGAFGWSLISPMTMVHLLTKLYEGKILNAQDRNMALNLMENIEYDQQVGVGDTAPNGATVAMKDGWVIGPDGSWAMNSSGIVTSGHVTYIISVYTTGQSDLGDGQGIARHVCETVASLLT